MGDYLTRLAEHALEVGSSARPVVPPLFAPAPAIESHDAALLYMEVPRPPDSSGDNGALDEQISNAITESLAATPRLVATGDPASTLDTGDTPLPGRQAPPEAAMADGRPGPSAIPMSGEPDLRAVATPAPPSRSWDDPVVESFPTARPDEGHRPGVSPAPPSIAPATESPSHTAAISRRDRTASTEAPETDLSPASDRTPEPALVRARNAASASDVQADASPGPAVAPPATEPNVRITINRVEVRAVTPEPARLSRPAPKRRGPAMSLDDYLKRRSGERR